MRSFVSAAAHGCMGTSSGLRSAAIFCKYFTPGLCHTPERSGLPSALRGAGAARFGLPSLVRGVDLSGSFNHCAAKGDSARNSNSAPPKPFFTKIEPPRCPRDYMSNGQGSTSQIQHPKVDVRSYLQWIEAE